MFRASITKYLFSLFLFIALLTSAYQAAAQTDYELMQEIVKQVTASTNVPIVGSGSWIEGSRFVPGTSDFDMRVIVRGGSPAEQMREWARTQQELTRLIKEKWFFDVDCGNMS